MKNKNGLDIKKNWKIPVSDVGESQDYTGLTNGVFVMIVLNNN